MPKSSGSPEPTLRVVPRSASTQGPLAVQLAAGYGLVADDWQADILEATLGRRKNGRFAAATVGQAVPRQNGKNGWLEIRELFGMVVLGEKFLHTAHEVKTSRKAFRRIASFFENEREFPELAALVKEIRKTNGQEAVVLDNGASVEFIARSSGSGRGFTVDVLVCDEAQDLTDDELAALLPTISAAPGGNPQVIITGTPPDPEKAHLAKGEVFRRVRGEAQARTDPALCFVDFGVPDGPLPDVDDKRLWYKTNPALGGRLNVAEVERERKLMSPEKFARERLGWWGDPKADGAGLFPASAWAGCATDEERGPVAAVALAVSIDRRWASIGAATAGEVPYLGAVHRFSSTVEAAQEAARIALEHGVPVVIDKGGPAADLFHVLDAAGATVLKAGTADYLDACAWLYDAVTEGRVKHGDHSDLNDAVRVSVRRPVGDRWAIGRKGGDVSMLEAVTLARWGAAQSADADPSIYVI